MKRGPKPRRRKVTVDEDQLYRKQLAEKKEALLRRESEARAEAEARNELLVKKEQLKKRKVSKKESPVIKRDHSLAKLRAVPKRQPSHEKLAIGVRSSKFAEVSTSDERMEVVLPVTKLVVEQPPPDKPTPVIMITDEDTSPAVIESDHVQELSHIPIQVPELSIPELSQSLSSDPDQEYVIDECSSDCFSSNSDDSDPPASKCNQLDLMQDELNNLKQLAANLRDRQSRTRKMLSSYRNRDYSFNGVYERARKLRRNKEDDMWEATQGSPTQSLALQPSTLAGTEKSFLDELNEAGDWGESWDMMDEITFGESTDL